MDLWVNPLARSRFIALATLKLNFGKFKIKMLRLSGFIWNFMLSLSLASDLFLSEYNIIAESRSNFFFLDQISSFFVLFISNRNKRKFKDELFDSVTRKHNFLFRFAIGVFLRFFNFDKTRNSFSFHFVMMKISSLISNY